MPKTLVIFDGSNFYHGVRKTAPKLHLSHFDYLKLSQILTKNKNTQVTYCVGEIRKEKNNKKSYSLYANQQKLFYHLESQGIKIQKGYMLKNKAVYHEKGVDVRIALEILKGALKNTYNTCYLISSDTDILPAIHEAQDTGKKVIYVGFSKKKSRALMNNCSKYVLLNKQQLENCNLPIKK
ncbi:MAG: NYN domain-containing protein [Patescibacteria group bacterium]